MSHLLLLFIFCPLLVQTQNESLVFTQVWFRHGERTPTKYLAFPTEPADTGKNLPFGKGELTNNGKRMEYILGKTLKTYYIQLLSSKYKADEIRVYFDDDNRTSTSAQLVMAGLYPPTDEEIWNDKLEWQPVSLHEQYILSHVSFGIFDKCPLAGNRLEQLPEYANILNNWEDQDMIRYLSSQTGIKTASPREFNDMIDNLITRYRMNDTRLPVPPWMSLPLYNSIRNISNYLHRTTIDLTRKSSGEWHCHQVLSTVDDHIKRPVNKKNRAVFYSGHDTNILTLGRMFGIPIVGDGLPGYGGHIALDLYNSTDGFYVKVWYAYNFNSSRQLVSIPQCGEPCYFDKLKALYGHNSWDDEKWWINCNGWGSIDRSGHSVSAILLITVIVLTITTVALLYTTCSYRNQLKQLRDPERRLLNPRGQQRFSSVHE